MRRRGSARAARRERVLGERGDRGDPRRGRHAGRLREHHARHHRAAGSASVARAGAGATRPVAEDGGARPVDRQHRPRLQQSLDDRQRPRAAAAPPAHRSQAFAGDRRGAFGRQPRREPDAPAAGLLATPAAQPGRRRPQGTRRGACTRCWSARCAETFSSNAISRRMSGRSRSTSPSSSSHWSTSRSMPEMRCPAAASSRCRRATSP